MAHEPNWIEVPKFALVAYETGIECPYCGVGADERCKTAKGWPVHGAHKKRVEAAEKSGVTLTRHVPPEHLLAKLKPAKAGSRFEEAMGKIKVAAYFIERCGGIEEAKRVLEAIEEVSGLSTD